MGASEHITKALKAKKIKKNKLAEMIGKTPRTVYNTLDRDAMTYTMVELYADALGCDVVLRDRETGEIY